MAKSRSFFGLRRGSTKSLTFQVNKGQQITKDRVYEVANPRTTQQMAQRLRFACAVQFFKHANQALFEYAFEDKKQLESDYNAFIRHNALNAGIVSRYMLERNYPAMGAFQLTQGSLGEFGVTLYNYSPEDDQSQTFYRVKGSEYQAGANDTVGDFWTYFLEQNPIFENGDIITIVEIGDENTIPVKSAAEAIAKFALCYAKEGVVASPSWKISQYKIDVNNTANLRDEGYDYTPFETDGWVDDEFMPLRTSIADSYDDTCLHGIAFIVSRPISSSEVKVTSSSICVNAATALALDVAKSTPWVEWCADTYEDSQLLLEADAILKGEIVENTESFNATIADPTAKTNMRVLATINKAENVAPSAVRVLVDVSGTQKRCTLEEDWVSGADVIDLSGLTTADVVRTANYAHYSADKIDIWVPMSEGLVSAGKVVGGSAWASQSVAFKLVGLSN